MKTNAIYDWLGCIETQNPTPLATLGLKCDTILYRKRPHMSERSGSPTKWMRLDNDLKESGFILTELTDRTRFEYATTSTSRNCSPSRQRSPARDLLNELRLSNPPIHCARPRDIRLPEMVLELWKMLVANFGSKVIPVGIKVSTRLFQQPPSLSNHVVMEQYLIWVS